jgi:predicted transcriptional regulator
MYMFLKIATHLKIENVDFVNNIVNNTLFLTLGTPNSSSL